MTEISSCIQGIHQLHTMMVRSFEEGTTLRCSVALVLGSHAAAATVGTGRWAQQAQRRQMATLAHSMLVERNWQQVKKFLCLIIKGLMSNFLHSHARTKLRISLEPHGASRLKSLRCHAFWAEGTGFSVSFVNLTVRVRCLRHHAVHCQVITLLREPRSLSRLTGC